MKIIRTSKRRLYTLWMPQRCHKKCLGFFVLFVFLVHYGYIKRLHHYSHLVNENCLTLRTWRRTKLNSKKRMSLNHLLYVMDVWKTLSKYHFLTLINTCVENDRLLDLISNVFGRTEEISQSLLGSVLVFCLSLQNGSRWNFSDISLD